MEYAIHTLLSRTAHAMQNYLRPHLNKLGLSPGQPKVLRCLAARGPCSQRMLADYCEVDPSAICRMLDSMERAGLVRRQPAPGSRREGLVTMTDAGRQAFDAWERQCVQIDGQMLTGFSEQERSQFRDYLLRAYHNMGGQAL